MGDKSIKLPKLRCSWADTSRESKRLHNLQDKRSVIPIALLDVDAWLTSPVVQQAATLMQTDKRGNEYYRASIGPRAANDYLSEAVRRFGLRNG